MNKEKRGQLHILALLVLGLAIGTVITFSLVFAPAGQQRIASGKLSTYDSPWVLKNYGGDGDKIINLPCDLNAKAGETVTLMGKVPADVRSDTVLVFETRFQNVMVLLNDDRIYSYGVLNDQRRMKNAVPHTNIVKIGDAKPGDVLTIYITSGYKKYSGKISEIFYGTESAVASEFIQRYGLGFVFGLVLLFVTVLLTIVVAFMKRSGFDRQKALYAFGFAVCASLWSVVKNPIMQLVFKNHYGLYVFQAVLLMLLPVLFMLYQSCFNMRRRFVKIFELTVYVFSVNLLTGVVFQALSVCDFASYLTFTKVLIFIGLLGLSAVLYMAKETFDDQALLTNMLASFILLAAWVIELVLSLFRFYVAYDGLVFSLGLYAYVILLSVSVIRHVVYEVNKEKDSALYSITVERKRLLANMNMRLVYESLNDVITSLKDKEYDESKLVYDASIYMQNNMKSVVSGEMVPFAKELEYIRAYAGIVCRKYKPLTFVIEDKVVEFSVPFNTIEPLVENAVINGALKSEAEGRIVLRSYERLDCFAIQIVDNGTGISPEKRFTGKQSYKDIRKRLKSMCGAGIEIKTKPGKGTIVTVKVPKDGYIIKE